MLQGSHSDKDKSDEDEEDDVRHGEEHGSLEGLEIVRVTAKSRSDEGDVLRQEGDTCLATLGSQSQIREDLMGAKKVGLCVLLDLTRTGGTGVVAGLCVSAIF